MCEAVGPLLPAATAGMLLRVAVLALVATTASTRAAHAEGECVINILSLMNCFERVCVCGTV